MTVADYPQRFPVERSAERFAGRVISVRTDWVRLAAGSLAERDVVVHPGAVGVVALDDADRVLLLRQYRHPVGRMLWEPPAGILDAPGEAAVDAARRELREEAHCTAARWWVLTDHFTSPGMTDEALRIYLARDVSAVPEQDRHVGEHEEADMPLEWVPLDDAVTKVLAGELNNPTAVVGILASAAAAARGWTGLRPADAPWPARPHGGGSKA